MHKLFHFICYVSFISLFGCIGSKPATGPATYAEDLTTYRLKFIPPDIEANGKDNTASAELVEYSVKNNINAVIDAKLEQLVGNNANITGFPGYRLLVFSGYDKGKAMELQKTLNTVLKEYQVDLVYEQPNFKVKLGNFLTKGEAYQLYAQIKEEFPETIVIPDIVQRDEIKY